MVDINIHMWINFDVSNCVLNILIAFVALLLTLIVLQLNIKSVRSVLTSQTGKY